MEKFKRAFTKIANDEPDITKIKDDFFFNVRLAILTAKTTKNTIPEDTIKQLIDKLWKQFVKDVIDPGIGLNKAIDTVFNKYK